MFLLSTEQSLFYLDCYIMKDPPSSFNAKQMRKRKGNRKQEEKAKESKEETSEGE